MGILNEFEKRILMQSILKDEKSKKNFEFITAQELLKILEKRYLIMREVLGDLKQKLSKRILITNMYFGNDLSNNPTIYIEYKDEIREATLMISQYDSDVFDVSSSNCESFHSFVEENQKTLEEAFKRECHYHFYEGVSLLSTSGKYSLNNHSNHTSFAYKKRKCLNMDFSFSLDEKSNLLVARKFESIYPDLSMFFQNEENVQSFLQKVCFYEQSMPKYLLKSK